MTTSIKLLIDWIKSFDPSSLQNEDNVETKFVIPLFQHLDYPEKCRFGKKPIDSYQTRNQRGRKNEADQVYYSEKDPNRQDFSTCLIVVEAKRPDKKYLDEDIAQARFYGFHLKAPFLVVTNGYHLKVLKIHQYCEDEILFDHSLEELQEEKTVINLYKLLNFEVIKQVKRELNDGLKHEHYVQLMQAINSYPDLQQILSKGDFEPLEKAWKGRELTVTKPKVRLISRMPFDFEEGSCQIEFSNVMLRGLKIYLTHEDILKQLMLGFNTNPSWSTRRFIRRVQEDTFEVVLGQTIATLSEAEIKDLCFCIDVMGNEYQKVLTDIEDKLETWNFRVKRIERGYAEPVIGFHLITVTRTLWELMKRFSMEFDHRDGDTEWHIFEHTSPLIQFSSRDSQHAMLWPTDQSIFLPTGYVEVLYERPYLHKDFFTGRKEEWESKMGKRGFWTAKYTQRWLINDFIPKVHLFYDYHPSELDFFYRDIHEQVPLIDDISEPKLFLPYLSDIQHWLSLYTADNISTKLLIPYFQAFNHLSQRVSAITAKDLHFLMKNREVIEYDSELMTDQEKQQKAFKKVLNLLDHQTKRITQVEYEDHWNIELMTQIFIIMLQGDIQGVQQEEINAAKKAIYPLWEQARFQIRYVVKDY
jgi:hypothetical protein